MSEFHIARLKITVCAVAKQDQAEAAKKPRKHSRAPMILKLGHGLFRKLSGVGNSNVACMKSGGDTGLFHLLEHVVVKLAAAIHVALKNLYTAQAFSPWPATSLVCAP